MPSTSYHTLTAYPCAAALSIYLLSIYQSMNISVLTPDRTIFTGNISSVMLPGVEGSFQLLDNHAPLVSALSGGKVTLQTGTGEYRFYDEEAKAMSESASSTRTMTFTIDRGFVEVLNNEVNLLVQGARNLR